LEKVQKSLKSWKNPKKILAAKKFRNSEKIFTRRKNLPKRKKEKNSSLRFVKNFL